MKQVLKWCEESKIVEGYVRSCVYDLKRKKYELVTKKCHGLISLIEGKTINENLSVLTEEDIEWMFFFIEQEYLLEIPEVFNENFSPISMIWDQPNFINNAIIHSQNNIPKVIYLLNSIVCKHIQLICENEEELILILDAYFRITNFHSVEVILLNVINENKELDEILEEYIVLSNIVIKDLNDKIEYAQKLYFNPFFITNIEMYIESQNFNLYLNKKIYFDENGNIKNSPESEDILGNINEINSRDELKSILENKNFQKNWDVSKSKCTVCSDCEFKSMCFDKRLPIECLNGLYFYKEECEYNPYIAKWRGDEGYKTLEQCGVVSNEKGFSIDHEKIAKINAVLWDEEEVEIE